MADEASTSLGPGKPPQHQTSLSRRLRRWLVLVAVLALLASLAWIGLAVMSNDGPHDGAATLKVQLRDSSETVYLLRNKDTGQYTYRISRLTGPPLNLTPEQFTSRVYQDQQATSLFTRILNITSPAGLIWVGLGLLGQVLFTGRMIVQWLASEKNHRSVVPSAFWWMSLSGATMLLVYFIWRKDVVGVLGQSVGWFIYVRNLWLIYNPHPQASIEPTIKSKDDSTSSAQQASAATR